MTIHSAPLLATTELAVCLSCPPPPSLPSHSASLLATTGAPSMPQLPSPCLPSLPLTPIRHHYWRRRELTVCLRCDHPFGITMGDDGSSKYASDALSPRLHRHHTYLVTTTGDGGSCQYPSDALSPRVHRTHTYLFFTTGDDGSSQECQRLAALTPGTIRTMQISRAQL